MVHSKDLVSENSIKLIEKKLQVEFDECLKQGQITLESKVDYETVRAILFTLGFVNSEVKDVKLLNEMCSLLTHPDCHPNDTNKVLVANLKDLIWTIVKIPLRH